MLSLLKLAQHGTIVLKRKAPGRVNSDSSWLHLNALLLLVGIASVVKLVQANSITLRSEAH